MSDALFERQDDLEAVVRLAIGINSGFDLDHVVQATCDAATALSDAQFGAFFFDAVDEKGESPRLFTVSGIPRERFASLGMPGKSRLLGPTFDGVATIRLDDVTADPRFGRNAPYLGFPPGHPPMRSYLAVPVSGRWRALTGALLLGHERPGMFTERHERLVLVIAAHAAVAIDNAKVFATERRARAEAEEAAGRLERLQSITARLSQARSLEEVAEVVVTTAAAGVSADRATLAHLSADGRRLRVLSAVGYEDDVIGRFTDMSLDDEVPAAEAVRTGNPVSWASPAERAERWPALASMPGRGIAGIAVPLLGINRTVGVAGFAWHTPQRFSDDELAFLSVVARQSAQAIERAQQFDGSIKAARTLQRSLLPPSIPVIEGLTIAARYQPVAGGSVVGGDFYDAFRRTPYSWGIVIGDVSGKGVQAATLTSLVRHTVRALGRLISSPVDVLCQLNDAILAEELDDRFATVVYLVAEPGACGIDLQFAVGGHPLPLHRTRDGQVRAVGTPGDVVGLLPQPELTVDRLTLEVGDMLVLYTDGFVEGRAPDGSFADGMLEEAVAASDAQTADALADELTTLMIEFQDGRPRDDMALMVLQATPH